MEPHSHHHQSVDEVLRMMNYADDRDDTSVLLLLLLGRFALSSREELSSFIHVISAIVPGETVCLVHVSSRRWEVLPQRQTREVPESWKTR